MGCETISMDKAESLIENAFYWVIGSQTGRAKLNTDIREKVNEEQEKEIEEYKKSVIPPGLKWMNTYIAPTVTAISIVFGVLCGGAALFGDEPLAVVFGMISAGALIIKGVLQLSTGIYQEKTAVSGGLIKQSTALEGYLSDRNDNINTKTKNAYQTLTSISRAFNKLIATYGDAVKKVIRK
jgi:hypothetical protein